MTVFGKCLQGHVGHDYNLIDLYISWMAGTLKNIHVQGLRNRRYTQIFSRNKSARG